MANWGNITWAGTTRLNAQNTVYGAVIDPMPLACTVDSVTFHLWDAGNDDVRVGLYEGTTTSSDGFDSATLAEDLGLTGSTYGGGGNTIVSTSASNPALGTTKYNVIAIKCKTGGNYFEPSHETTGGENCHGRCAATSSEMSVDGDDAYESGPITAAGSVDTSTMTKAYITYSASSGSAQADGVGFASAAGAILGGSGGIPIFAYHYQHHM